VGGKTTAPKKPYYKKYRPRDEEGEPRSKPAYREGKDRFKGKGKENAPEAEEKKEKEAKPKTVTNLDEKPSVVAVKGKGLKDLFS